MTVALPDIPQAKRGPHSEVPAMQESALKFVHCPARQRRNKPLYRSAHLEKHPDNHPVVADWIEVPSSVLREILL
jgi:hypothetical protein